MKRKKDNIDSIAENEDCEFKESNTDNGDDLTDGAAVKKVKKPVYKRVWFYFVILLCVIVITIAGVGISLPFSYSVYAWGLRLACTPDDNPSVPANYETISAGTQIEYGVDYESSIENGVMDVIYPTGREGKLPLFLYIHGGYYVGGGRSSATPYCRAIAYEGYVVANIDYLLAPEGHYPSQLIQANEAIDYMIENAAKYNVDTDKIFISGDSAGAHLASQLGAFYTNPELAQKIGVTPAAPADAIKGVALLCGFYNIRTLSDTKFPFINQAMWILTDHKDYLNYERISELDTVANATENYPSAYITCGGGDLFYSQARELANTLKSKGVKTEAYLPESDKLGHEFQREFGFPEAVTAFEILISFLNDLS